MKLSKLIEYQEDIEHFPSDGSFHKKYSYFEWSKRNLKSLQYGPTEVTCCYNVSNNKLTSLKVLLHLLG